jgi:hypothetical protein
MWFIILSLLASVLEGICYWVGRVVVTGFTFGRVRCEPFHGRDDFGWLGRTIVSDGTYALSAPITTIVGLIVLALVIVLVGREN